MFAYCERQREIGLRDMQVTTLFGRTLKMPTQFADNKSEQAMTRHIGNCAINFPIQGSASEIFKRIRIALLARIPIEDYVLQVHDEQLHDGEYDIPKEELAHIAPFYTPMEVKVSERWA